MPRDLKAVWRLSSQVHGYAWLHGNHFTVWQPLRDQASFTVEADLGAVIHEIYRRRHPYLRILMGEAARGRSYEADKDGILVVL